MTGTMVNVLGRPATKGRWQGTFRRAGIDYRKRAESIHALRHSYASVLLTQGVSIKELAGYLGHTDSGFTLRTYTHLVSSSHEPCSAGDRGRVWKAGMLTVLGAA